MKISESDSDTSLDITTQSQILPMLKYLILRLKKVIFLHLDPPMSPNLSKGHKNNTSSSSSSEEKCDIDIEVGETEKRLGKSQMFKHKRQ